MNKRTLVIQAVIILYFLIGLIVQIIDKSFLSNFSEIYLSIILLFTFFTLFPGLNKHEKQKFTILFSLILLIVYLLMLIGEATGVIFGHFVYFERMKLTFIGVPFVITLNYVMIILGSFHISRNFLKSFWLKILVSGLLVMFFNFIFEPIAIKYGYWAWTDYFRINYGGIPLQNFVSWFFTGAISGLIIYFFKQKLESKILFVFWFSELFFFQLLQIL